MADTYEKDLSAKTTMTASDYIRVVGSDNVSYKQSVNNINSTIPLTLVVGLTTQALIDQAYITAHNETPDQTLYRRMMNHGAQHDPMGGGRYYLEGYRESSTYGWQKTTSYGNPTKMYTRSLNNGTWTSWQQYPTRAEVDTLKTATSVTVTASTNVVIDTNKSQKMGRLLFLYVKGHTTDNIGNASLFTFTGGPVSPAQFTFGIPIGDNAWGINGIAYGYINEGGVVATISSGKYFHICNVFLTT